MTAPNTFPYPAPKGVSAEKSVQKPPARLLQLAVYPQRLPALVACHEIVAMHRRAVRVAEIPPADFDPLRPGNQYQLASVIWKLVLLRQRLRSGQDQQRALQRRCQPDRGARAAALGGKRRDPDRMLGPVVVDCLQLEYALGAEPRVQGFGQLQPVQPVANAVLRRWQQAGVQYLKRRQA